MRGLKYDDKFLLLLYDKMLYYHNHYLYPSQETLLKWLCNQGGLDVSRRTLNRYLRQLQNRQIIGRIRRIKHNKRGGFIFATTLYSIGILGLQKLHTMGVIAFDELRAWIKNSTPFRSRIPKRPKKGLTPSDQGFYKDARSLGGIVKVLI